MSTPTAPTEFPIDLSNYKDKRGSLIKPDGVYRVQVEDAEWKAPTEQQSKSAIVLYFRILAPGTENDGKTVVDRLWMTDASMWRTVAFLEAIEVPTPRKKFALPPSLIRGKTLKVKLEEGEPWNGRPPKSEVREFLIDDGAAAPSAPAEAPAAPAAEVAVEAPAATEPEASANGSEDGAEQAVEVDASTGVDLDALSL